MRNVLTALTAGLFLFPLLTWAQTSNPCDLNGDGTVNSTDQQLAINMALGKSSCTANIVGSGVCDVVVVQRVINASLGGACRTGTGAISHDVALTWSASTSAGISGYNVYRASTSGGPYTKVTPTQVTGTSYVDSSVQSGTTYYYVTTALSGSTESTYSNQAQANVPTP